MDEVLAQGDVSARQILLEIIDRTLEKLDSYQRIKSIMRMEGMRAAYRHALASHTTSRDRPLISDSFALAAM
ncbi:hypothetical protein DIE23_09875 [Burkholderia sp. Bp9143]|uniref:hypothetical protein n=1 Tax=Burkholderia sp. Bp9143 TaxID=2184574 RepID=UPI000F59EDEA|nr:hypothetical protein [Burkholderia sp. Bp9143]RQR35482.1 hypothetical protein DIE23_09875 [Burkholderia sp. Bp9143]